MGQLLIGITILCVCCMYYVNMMSELLIGITILCMYYVNVMTESLTGITEFGSCQRAVGTVAWRCFDAKL